MTLRIYDKYPHNQIENIKFRVPTCITHTQSHYHIYTDGSKEDSKVGCAVISDNHSNMQRIPNDSSVFTAEVKAIVCLFVWCLTTHQPLWVISVRRY